MGYRTKVQHIARKGSEQFSRIPNQPPLALHPASLASGASGFGTERRFKGMRRQAPPSFDALIIRLTRAGACVPRGAYPVEKRNWN